MTEPSKDAPEKHLFYWLNLIRNRAIVHGASWANPKVWTVKNFTRHDFDSDNWMKLQMAVAYIILHHRIWNAGQGTVAIPGGPRNPNLGQLKRAVRGRLLELLRSEREEGQWMCKEPWSAIYEWWSVIALVSILSEADKGGDVEVATACRQNLRALVAMELLAGVGRGSKFRYLKWGGDWQRFSGGLFGGRSLSFQQSGGTRYPIHFDANHLNWVLPMICGVSRPSETWVRSMDAYKILSSVGTVLPEMGDHFRSVLRAGQPTPAQARELVELVGAHSCRVPFHIYRYVDGSCLTTMSHARGLSTSTDPVYGCYQTKDGSKWWLYGDDGIRQSKANGEATLTNRSSASLELLDRNPYLLPTDQADPRYLVTGRQVELRVPSRANIAWSVSLLPGLGATFYGPSRDEEVSAPPEEPAGSRTRAFDWIPAVSEIWQAIQGLEDGSEQRELLELIGQVIKWAGTDFDAHRDDIARALESALRRFLS